MIYLRWKKTALDGVVDMGLERKDAVDDDTQTLDLGRRILSVLSLRKLEQSQYLIPCKQAQREVVAFEET